MIRKYKKDEKFSPWNTNLIKTHKKTFTLQGDLYKKNKQIIQKYNSKSSTQLLTK